MNILLVNDDGIQSEGIQVLYKRLSKEHKVFVLAPDSNRSAVSHHISIFNKNRTQKKKYWKLLRILKNIYLLELKKQQ